MTVTNNMKSWLNRLFLLALLVPLFAAIRSPQFGTVLDATLKDPSSWDAQRDRLRRATPLWNSAISGYSWLQYELGTTADKRIALLGKDGYMYLGDNFNNNFSQAIGRRVLSDEEVREWSANFKEKQNFLAEQGIPMLFVVAPAKWSIYEDKLPGWAPTKVKHSFDRILNSPGRPNLIDLRAALIQSRKVAEPYSKLNSHWTDYGALVAWRNIAYQLGQIDPKLAGLRVPEFSGVQYVDYGSEFRDLISLPIANDWSQPNLTVPLSNFQIVSNDGSVQEVPGSTHTGLLDLPRLTRNPSVKNGVRALILRDSMGDSLSIYLQNAFEETYQVGHKLDAPENSPDFAALVQSFKPTVVLYVMTERYFDKLPVDGTAGLDSSKFDEVAKWSPRESSDPSVRLEGDRTVPEAISFYWQAADTRKHVLEIELQGKGGGQIQVQLYAAGKPYVLGREYGAGARVVRFELPEQVDGSRVTIVRGPSSAPLSLDTIKLYAAK